MQHFHTELIHKRTVAIWGAGYLGYTEALHMQAQGFSVILWDYFPGRLDELRNKRYPDANIKAAWSLARELPELDLTRVILTDNASIPLEAPVHLICIPAEDSQTYKRVGDLLHQELLPNADSLLLFLSATSPGFIESLFLHNGTSQKASCGIATAFRQDWYFEELLTDQNSRILGANDVRSLTMARMFFDMLHQSISPLPSIKAAEIMAHAQQLLQAMNDTFVNQLAFAFPDTDTRVMVEKLFERLTPRLRVPCFGNLDIRQVSALCHLASSSGAADKLSLAQHVQRAGLSTLLAYGDLLLTHAVKHAAILGLSPQLAAQRDPRMSPSIILADYLHKNGMHITVHDPYYDEVSLHDLLPYATPWDLKTPLHTDAVLIMRELPSCRALTQQKLEILGITNARMVLDNVGIFRFNTFPDSCLYHVPGDGTLSELER